ncbi:cytoplasmic protein [Coprinopsis cinerea okayama7|uniref:Cytoplasmic protein n=1 Tax=Coprinopsis cinerea (strain Okayama-7 / 130 / ATCC MYA-4618 / FGSC 9003) TaxID=240176 RepID=A8NW80_COPC7|nr:cytoplasmic protein [Coprinopsis cinerea okayama7\|eukprot:XP_001836852.2 cytoplasmic protein [Coprinopsis cinerea okayama7\
MQAKVAVHVHKVTSTHFGAPTTIPATKFNEMRRFFQGFKSDVDKFKDQVQEHVAQFSPGDVSSPGVEDFDEHESEHTKIFPVRQEDLLKYRKHRGVNLGSWFVLERWITDSPFREAAAPAASDLDVAKGRNAKSILERHWDTWIQPADWDWIAARGINSVRIPIGYYHVCGADRSILDGTDFWPFYDVYQGAWRRITNAILEANKRGITVQLAPGKQNADPHSGTSNPANFFHDPHNLRRGLYALQSLSMHLTSFLNSHDPPLSNVVSIELVNEPAPPNDGVLKRWYDDAIRVVQRGARGVPVYIGECWRPEVYAEYVARELKQEDPEGLVVLDHHLYRCFTQEDINTSVYDHTGRLRDHNGILSTFTRVAELVGRAGGALSVCEWSGGLNEGSLKHVRGEDQRRNARRDFLRAQLELYERTCAGWYFWTYKKEYRGDVGWSFREAVEEGVFPMKNGRIDAGILVRKKRWTDADVERECVRRVGKMEEERKKAYDAHRSYWSRIPGRYEHRRFWYGFTAGWNMAWRFYDSIEPDGE